MANLKMNGLELGTIADVDVLPTYDINPHIFYRMNNALYVYDPISMTWTNIMSAPVMVGATSTTDGESGSVPQPLKTDGGAPKMLLSTGEWGDLGYYGGVYTDGPSGTGASYVRLYYPLKEAYNNKQVNPAVTTVLTANCYAAVLESTNDHYLCESYLIITPKEVVPEITATLMLYLYGENNNTLFGSASLDFVYGAGGTVGIQSDWVERLCRDVFEHIRRAGADSAAMKPPAKNHPLGWKIDRSYDSSKNGMIKNTQYMTNFNIGTKLYDIALVKTTIIAQYESVCNRAIIVQDAIVGKNDDSSVGYKPIKYRRYGTTYFTFADTFRMYYDNANWTDWSEVGAVENSIMMLEQAEYDELVENGSIHPRVIYAVKD